MASGGDRPAAVAITAEAKLMNIGTLKGTMELPMGGQELSLHYMASLGPMDLRSLNSYLGVAGHARIDSGNLHTASCEIDVIAGHARGRFEAAYRDLKITVLDRQTASEDGVLNRLKSAFVNHVALRTSNPADRSGSVKVGVVDYTRSPNEKFMRFAWLAIRSGMLDLLGLTPYVKAPS
jgi:hypothetical protein